MKFSLLLSISAICRSSDAFTIQKLSSPSSVLQLSAKKESFVIDPDDPYANLLKAYGKKSVLVEEPKEIAIPSIPDTIVPDTTVVVTPDVTSSASTSSSTSLDSITDAANQAIAAAQEAVKAASDLGSTASTSTTTVTPISSGDVVAPPLVDFLKEPEKFKSMADQASSSVEKVLSVVNSPSTPSTTGASTGTTVVEPGKTVTLYQYLVNPATHTSTSAPTESFDAIANAKEKFSIMLENTLKFSNSVTESTTRSAASGELTKGLAVPASMKSVAAGGAAAGATSAAGAGFDLSSVFNSAEWDQLAKNLNLEEYGAWYVAALAFFFGVNQSAAKKSATNVYEKEMSMAKEKADVAASAALDAVEQVQKAKELASTKAKTTSSGGVKTDLLSEAKVRELQVEKDMLKEELLTTKALVSQLKSQLSLMNTITDTAAASIISSPEITQKILTKTSSERDPEEDMRFVELLKGIDDANSKTKKKKTTKQKTKQKTKKKATKKTTKKKKEPEPEPEPVAVVEPEPEPEPVAFEEKVSTVKKAAKKKATKKKKKKKKQTTEAAKTKAVEPETIEEAIPPTPTPTSEEEHPWAKLSTSTLSRKTVAELTGFLTEKGIAVADAESGKTFTKKVLVAEVQKIL